MNNREKIFYYSYKFDNNNINKILKYSHNDYLKFYRNNNKNKILIIQNRYRKNNKEKIKIHYKQNKDKYNMNRRKKRKLIKIIQK